MKIFHKKPVQKPEQIGDKLRQLRENSNLSIEEMEELTKLNKDFILAIESSAFHKLPKGKLYKKLFIKRYLKPFDINKEKYLKEIEGNASIDWTKKPDFLSKKNVPLFAKAFCVVLLVGSLIGFIGLQIDQILDPPKLLVNSPTKNFKTNQDKVTIQGKTKKEATISINGKRVSHNKKGVFEKKIKLKQGLNTIVIKAKKEHGKPNTKVRHVVKEKNSKFSLTQDDNKET